MSLCAGTVFNEGHVQDSIGIDGGVIRCLYLYAGKEAPCMVEIATACGTYKVRVVVVADDVVVVAVYIYIYIYIYLSLYIYTHNDIHIHTHSCEDI